MTADDRFLPTLEAWLDDQAGQATPPYVEELLARSRQTRQQPWWSSLERWLPQLRAASTQLAGVPRTARIVLVAVLALALVVAAISGLSRPPLPEPLHLQANGLIAMANVDAIIVADADGSNPRRLAPVPHGVESLTFSPDGTRLAYRSLGPGTREPTIVVIDLASGRLVDVSPDLRIEVGLDVIAWSPDSRWIVSAVRIGDAPSHLRSFAADGSGGVELAPAATDLRTNAFAPAWSADGRFVAFLGSLVGSNQTGLFVMNADGSDERFVATVPPIHGITGAWSPDPARPRLVYVGTDGGLAIFDLTSGSSVDLGKARSRGDWWPTWSPDGTRLAWFDGGVLIAPVDTLLAGGEPERLTTVKGRCGTDISATGESICGQPVWSPDGLWVVGPDVAGASIVALRVDRSRPPVHIVIPNASGLTGAGSVAWQGIAPP
jgi:hypothetical protein